MPRFGPLLVLLALAPGCGEQNLGVLVDGPSSGNGNRNGSTEPMPDPDPVPFPTDVVPESDWDALDDALIAAQANAGDEAPNVAAVGPDLASLPSPRFAGIVHGFDGFVYAVPARARRFLRIDPNAIDQAELIGPEIPDGEWGGAAVASDGVIYLAPLDQARVFAFNPAAPDSAGFVGPDYSSQASPRWRGFVPALDGRLYAIPASASSVLAFDPLDPGASALLGGGLSGFDGGILAPDGSVYGIPSEAEQVLWVEPLSGTVVLSGPRIGPESEKFSAGSLSPDGVAYAFGKRSRSVLSFTLQNPVSPQQRGSFAGSAPFFVRSSSIAADGRVYAVPASANRVVRFDSRLPGELERVGPEFSGSQQWRGLVLTTNGALLAAPYNASRLLRITVQGDPLPASTVVSPFFNYY
ncbi:MAG: hypothetical protein AAF654_11205 [Myxococcota bacterium]